MIPQMHKDEFAGSPYMQGYLDGWSHNDPMYIKISPSDEEYQQGYEDGTADAEAADLSDELWEARADELHEMVFPRKGRKDV